MTSERLSARQVVFCTAYVETANAAEAYRRAYKCEGKSAAAVNRAAKAFLEKPAVAARIDELFREKAASQAGGREPVTLESLTAELEAVRVASMAFGQASSACATWR